MADKGHSPSILLHAHSLAPILLWEWQQQNPHHNIRFVRLAASDVSQLADVAYALQQYPRIKFVVYCDCLTAAEGSASYAVLHNVLTGEVAPCWRLFAALLLQWPLPKLPMYPVVHSAFSFQAENMGCRCGVAQKCAFLRQQSRQCRVHCRAHTVLCHNLTLDIQRQAVAEQDVQHWRLGAGSAACAAIAN